VVAEVMAVALRRYLEFLSIHHKLGEEFPSPI